MRKRGKPREAPRKPRPKLKPSAKARKRKAMRGLVRLDAAAPVLAQVRGICLGITRGK